MAQEWALREIIIGRRKKYSLMKGRLINTKSSKSLVKRAKVYVAAIECTAHKKGGKINKKEVSPGESVWMLLFAFATTTWRRGERAVRAGNRARARCSARPLVCARVTACDADRLVGVAESGD